MILQFSTSCLKRRRRAWFAVPLVYAAFGVHAEDSGPPPQYDQFINCPAGRTIDIVDFAGVTELYCVNANGVADGPAVGVSKITPGVVSSRGQYANGRETGTWLLFHDRTGARSSESRYVDGKLSGVSRSWSETGQLMQEGNWLAGERDGVWNDWRPDGKRQSSIAYSKGMYHGQMDFWDEAGMLRERRFVQGNVIKSIRYWSEKGTPLADDLIPLECRHDLVEGSCPWRGMTREERMIHPPQPGVYHSVSITKIPLIGDIDTILDEWVKLVRKSRLEIAFTGSTRDLALLVTTPQPYDAGRQVHYQFEVKVDGCAAPDCKLTIRSNRVLVPVIDGQRTPALASSDDDALTRSMTDVVQSYLQKFRAARETGLPTSFFPHGLFR